MLFQTWHHTPILLTIQNPVLRRRPPQETGWHLHFVFVASDSWASDSNGNGVGDSVEIASDPRLDCNHNGIFDHCDVMPRGISFSGHLGFPDIGSPPLFADFNADSRPDVITRNKENGFSFYANDGHGGLAFVDSVNYSNSTLIEAIEDIQTGKFSSSSGKYPEFIVSVKRLLRPGPRFIDSYIYLLSTTNGKDFSTKMVSFVDPHGLIDGDWSSHSYIRVVSADFNDDLLSDIALATYNGSSFQLVVAFNRGNGLLYEISFVKKCRA